MTKPKERLRGRLNFTRVASIWQNVSRAVIFLRVDEWHQSFLSKNHSTITGDGYLYINDNSGILGKIRVLRTEVEPMMLPLLVRMPCC